MMATDIRGRLMSCSYCKRKKVVMVNNELYLGRRGRRCFQGSVSSESPALVVGFSREYEYLLRVRFEGKKSIHTVNWSHFCKCVEESQNS